MKGSPVRVRASAFCDLQGCFALHRGLSEGLRGLLEVYLVKGSKRKRPFCRPFLSRKWGRERSGGCPLESAPVPSSQFKSKRTPNAVVKGSRVRGQVDAVRDRRDDERPQRSGSRGHLPLL